MWMMYDGQGQQQSTVIFLIITNLWTLAVSNFFFFFVAYLMLCLLLSIIIVYKCIVGHQKLFDKEYCKFINWTGLLSFIMAYV